MITLAIIKPDAVGAGKAGKILAQLESAGFKIRAARLVKLTTAQAEAFYAVHRQRSGLYRGAARGGGSAVRGIGGGPDRARACERTIAGGRSGALLLEGLTACPGWGGVSPLSSAGPPDRYGRHPRAVYRRPRRPGGPGLLPAGARRDAGRSPARGARGAAARRAAVGGVPGGLPRAVPALWQRPERGPLRLPAGPGSALAGARRSQGQASRLKRTIHGRTEAKDLQTEKACPPHALQGGAHHAPAVPPVWRPEAAAPRLSDLRLLPRRAAGGSRGLT